MTTEDDDDDDDDDDSEDLCVAEVSGCATTHDNARNADTRSLRKILCADSNAWNSLHNSENTYLLSPVKFFSPVTEV